MITMTIRKILEMGMCLSRRTRHSLNIRSILRLTGQGYSEHGRQVWLSSFLTGKPSFVTIGQSSWTSFMPCQQTLSSRFYSMPMSMISTQRSLSTLMITINSISHFSLKCYHLLCQALRMLTSTLLLLSRPFLGAIRSMWMCLVATGAMVCASRRSVQITGSMGFAVSVVKDTKQRITNSASLSFRLATEHELANLKEHVARFVEIGPHSLSSILPSLKCKPSSNLDSPQFCRGFVWSDNSLDDISPSALYTESAPPLPSPPQHLLDDSKLQESICSLGDVIKVETPFNVNKFELLLADHPNQPFVQSVMHSLCKGFWPFDKGDWKIELEEVIPNYASSDEDAEAIHALKVVIEKSLLDDGLILWMALSCFQV